MRSGNLRHRITLQRPVKSQSTSGAESISWATVAQVWAQVLTLRGKEYLTHQELHSKVDAKIIIRYRSDITNQWRITSGSHTYQIEHVVDLMGRTRELEIMVSEIS